MIDDPAKYGLEHSEWRPYQRKTLQWALELTKAKAVGVLEAPTGSGKTSFARGIGSQYRTVSLVKTKALQVENYASKYHFDILYGKGNYACVHENADDGAKASHCLFAGKMTKCPVADQCPYLQARQVAMESNVLSLNYSYWLASPNMRHRDIDCLVLDEAHQLSQEVLNHVGLNIESKTLSDWGLPEWPKLTSLTIGIEKSRYEMAAEWLNLCANRLARMMDKLRGPDGQIEFKRKYDALSRLKDKFEATADALTISEDDWHIRVSDEGDELVIRPLTARHHFKHLFLNGHATLAMSGTIGDMTTFTEELGLESPLTRRVESSWPASVRPVYLLDVPRLGYKSGNSDYDQQARVIAKSINDCPRWWKGIIHVTRKSEPQYIARRLVRYGLDESRIFIPSTVGSTDSNLADWVEFRKRTKGAICISWAMWEGVDLTEERICIVTKVPFADTSDAYERSRMYKYEGFYNQRAAWTLEQGLGRTRRGEASDYDMNGKREQLVAIADGNYSRVKSYLSPAMQESLVTYP